MGGALKLKGDTPWLIEKRKKKKERRKDKEPTDKENQDVIVGADGKPIDPSSISVMSKNTYDEEFAHEMEKLKKGGETKSVPWGSTVRAPPEILHGDELFSDSYPHEEVENGFFLESEGQENIDIGANPSAEGGGDDEGVSGDSVKVVNLINAFRLQEQPSYSKKDLTVYLKAWVGKVMKHLGEVSPEKQAEFKKTAPDAVKFLISKAKELQFFLGESLDSDGSMVFAYYKEGAANPTFLFPKYALKEEKC